MGILEKISEIEKEITRTQKNKGLNIKIIFLFFFHIYNSMIVKQNFYSNY